MTDSSIKNPIAHDLNDKARSLRVLLMEPLYPPEVAWGSVKGRKGFFPPMGIISIYNWLKTRGYNVDFLDTQFENFNAETLKTYLKNKRYDVVGMSVFTPTADYAFQTAKLVKEALPRCKVVMGNIHVTLLPELSMSQCPELDFIVMQEGEFTMDELLYALANENNTWADISGIVYRDGSNIVINPSRPLIENLDALPLGFYNDLDIIDYIPQITQYIRLPHYPIFTQRGCPYSCFYIAVPQKS